MKLTKTIALTLGSAALALTAIAAPRLDDSIAELNNVVAGILAPFQTEVSSAELKFLDIRTSDTNLLSVKASGQYQRIGKVQTMTVTLADLSYDLVGGKHTVVLSGSAGLDLTQLFQQDQLNGLVEAAEGLVVDLVKNYTSAYGDAVALEARMLETLKDEAGNYTAFTARVTAAIDLSKLPADKKAEDMPLLGATLDVNVVLNRGINLAASAELNPGFKGFHGDTATSPKAALERLLTRDAGSAEKIIAVLKQLDGIAAGLVDASVK